MASYQGYAYREKEAKPTREEINARYREIKDTPGVNMKKTVGYAHHTFRGTLETDEAKALSEMDILILADQGNLCFGGSCSRTGDGFNGRYYTD